MLARERMEESRTWLVERAAVPSVADEWPNKWPVLVSPGRYERFLPGGLAVDGYRMMAELNRRKICIGGGVDDEYIYQGGCSETPSLAPSL